MNPWQAFSARAFWLISRSALAGYRRFPIFGSLRAAVGIIRQGDRYLLIQRNDGRGFSFPGGLAWPWESEEHAVRREITEETGLEVLSAELDFKYHSGRDVQCDISAFKVTVTGQLHGSWEGTPVWVDGNAMPERILPSQAAIVERIASYERQSAQQTTAGI